MTTAPTSTRPDHITVIADNTPGAHACQGPAGSAHRRPVVLPAGGHQNCPLMASGSARGVSWSVASLLCLGLLG